MLVPPGSRTQDIPRTANDCEDRDGEDHQDPPKKPFRGMLLDASKLFPFRGMLLDASKMFPFEVDELTNTRSPENKKDQDC
jgi:hypothetical protein